MKGSELIRINQRQTDMNTGFAVVMRALCPEWLKLPGNNHLVERDPSAMMIHPCNDFFRGSMSGDEWIGRFLAQYRQFQAGFSKPATHARQSKSPFG
jgi:hypothetical protein